MLGSSALEIAIGVMFIYLFLSLICTSVMEAISSILNKRGKTLFEGIKNLLNDPQFTGLAQQIYSHGLVSSISEYASDKQKPNRLPSYMPSKILSSALVDILSSTGAALNPCWSQLVADRTSALARAQDAATANPANADLKAAVDAAQADLTKAQKMQSDANATLNQLNQAVKLANEVNGPDDFEKIEAAAQAFSKALDGGRTLAAQLPDPLENIEVGIRQHVPDGHTKDSLLLLVVKARHETSAIKDAAGSAARRMEAFETQVNQWYDQAMDRVTGWYKRWTQVVLVVIAAVAVSLANADTIMLVKVLMDNDTVRASISGAAFDVVSAAQPAAMGSASAPAAVDPAVVRAEALKDARAIDLPLGWNLQEAAFRQPTAFPSTFAGWFLKILGIVITIAAVSLGAPFWFDTLSKFVNLRGAGTPPGQQSKSAPRGTAPK
ncbi:hypothetical protein [Paraburkholderia acidiphila]|uniref:Uncharacterized protein n=1 Tax=Paraburkholderia acidiphila TaxID=2571747 RepID=A0A7Z2GCD2_9BURK|nr:hypothetical protein [Paraburkholderia acidiphila]QGZ58930.1 hypothetical protein FAZ97_28720 [Paraburkholderia acidiphila]